MRGQSFLIILALCLPFATAALAGDPFMLMDIYPGSSGSSPSYLTNVNGILFFSATDGINGTDVMEKRWLRSRHRYG